MGYMQEYALAYLKEEGKLQQASRHLGRARLLGDERIAGLAQKYAKTPAQVLLRYLVQRGIPVIPKASTAQRMRENTDIFGFELTEDEMSFLSCFPQTGWSGEHPDIV